MKKTRQINLASFKAESWPVAIRPARLRKSSKPGRVLYLGTALSLLAASAAEPVAVRELRLEVL